MKFPLSTPFVSALVALACAGCGDDGNGSSAGFDAGSEVRCPDDLPPFATGLSASSEDGEITAKLVRATPTPPRKYRNDWTLDFVDADGSPRQDLAIVEACAFMRVHGHGLSTSAITEQSEPGRFQIDELDFRMRGPWEVQLVVSPDGASDAGSVTSDCDRRNERPGQQRITFHVCVEDE